METQTTQMKYEVIGAGMAQKRAKTAVSHPLMSQFAMHLEPITAYYSDSDGSFVGAECRRLLDGEIRYYAVHQLRHHDGIHGVIAALESAPSKRRGGVR
jgi:hypothetical protein